MIFEFDDFQLDVDRAELRSGNTEIPLEPKIFTLLRLLVENEHRMVPKDEIVDAVWDGRFISESSVSTAIKAVRQALDDDGTTQKYIRTVRGRGFRFVGSARQGSEASAAQPASIEPVEAVADTSGTQVQTSRPSIAVVPFKMVGNNEAYAAIADALPAELIASLSRLRWLMVVARGSTFQFRDDALDLSAINTALGANYCLSGIVEIYGSELIIAVELSDTRTQNVIWSDRFAGKIDDVHQMRERIVAEVVSALELRIPLNEAESARLKSPESLDAWGLYHLGLHHVFQFNATDTDVATSHFERAIALDPSFARARAGLSYTHFQNAFQRFTGDPQNEQTLARKYAEESMALDPLDPFVNLALGRSEWLEGNFESSRSWMERSIDLNPNYAYGLYNHSLLNAILCDGERGEDSAMKALTLSPLDPVRASMSAIRGMNCLIRGNDAAAVTWANRAVQCSGRHAFVYSLAAIIHAHVGDQVTARSCVAGLHEINPTFRQDDFFKRFHFQDPTRLRSAQKTLKSIGLR